MENECIFCKIIAGIIPSTKVFENDDLVIIKDINPQAKCHYLLITKLHFDDIADLSIKNPQLLSRCFQVISKISESLGLENGYRLITNKGDDGCQSVKHIHIHIVGGQHLSEKMC